MRTCRQCGIEKPAEEFAVRLDRPDGRSTLCLACQCLYARAHYRSNRSYYLDKAAKARKRVKSDNLDFLIAYLRSHPCVDCGESDIRVLQFDHVDPGTKVSNVSLLLRKRPWKLVLPEIAKCAVRCANCHRRKTMRERDFSRSDGPAVAEDAPLGCPRPIRDNLVRAVSSAG